MIIFSRPPTRHFIRDVYRTTSHKYLPLHSASCHRNAGRSGWRFTAVKDLIPMHTCISVVVVVAVGNMLFFIKSMGAVCCSVKVKSISPGVAFTRPLFSRCDETILFQEKFRSPILPSRFHSVGCFPGKGSIPPGVGVGVARQPTAYITVTSTVLNNQDCFVLCPFQLVTNITVTNTVLNDQESIFTVPF